jgi:hypothetical protein
MHINLRPTLIFCFTMRLVSSFFFDLFVTLMFYVHLILYIANLPLKFYLSLQTDSSIVTQAVY